MIEEYDDYLEDMVADEANTYGQASHLYTKDMLNNLLSIIKILSVDRQTLTEMGVANLTLKIENSELKVTVKKLSEKLNSLFQKHTALKNWVCTCKGKKSTTPQPDRQVSKNPYTCKARYCFTCGIQPWYQSSKCKLGAPGHKMDATMENKIRGNQTSYMI